MADTSKLRKKHTPIYHDISELPAEGLPPRDRALLAQIWDKLTPGTQETMIRLVHDLAATAAAPTEHRPRDPQVAEASSDYETREILADPDLMAGLHQDIADPNEGELIPWEQVKRDLGL